MQDALEVLKEKTLVWTVLRRSALGRDVDEVTKSVFGIGRAWCRLQENYRLTLPRTVQLPIPPTLS